MKERYQNLEAIGGSTHANFFVATDAESGLQVFIKHFDQSDSPHFRTELAMYLNIDSEHIVRLHDFFYVGDGTAALVIRYFSDGNLRDYVSKKGNLKTGQVFDCLMDILNALIDLHENGYVHGDIKPENILIESVCSERSEEQSKLKFYLSDLGTITTLGGSLRDRLPAGTPAYRAPELSRFEYSEASDIYSLGVTLYHLLSGKIDLENLEPHDLKAINLIDVENPDFRDIISNLTFRNENNRLGNARFLRDWVQGLKPGLEKKSHRNVQSLGVDGRSAIGSLSQNSFSECSLGILNGDNVENIELCNSGDSLFLIVKHRNYVEFIDLAGSFSNSKLLSSDVFLFSTRSSAQVAAIPLRQGIELIQHVGGDLKRKYERLGSEKIHYVSINDHWLLWNDGKAWYCKKNHSDNRYQPGIDTRYYGDPKGAIMANGWYAISHGRYNQKVSIVFKDRIAKTCLLEGAVERIFAGESGFIVMEKNLDSPAGRSMDYGFWFFGITDNLRRIDVPENIKKIIDDHANIFLISDTGNVFFITKQGEVKNISKLDPKIEILSITSTPGQFWAIEKQAHNSYRLTKLEGANSDRP